MRRVHPLPHFPPRGFACRRSIPARSKISAGTIRSGTPAYRARAPLRCAASCNAGSFGLAVELVLFSCACFTCSKLNAGSSEWPSRRLASRLPRYLPSAEQPEEPIQPTSVGPSRCRRLAYQRDWRGHQPQPVSQNGLFLVTSVVALSVLIVREHAAGTRGSCFGTEAGATLDCSPGGFHANSSIGAS